RRLLPTHQCVGFHPRNRFTTHNRAPHFRGGFSSVPSVFSVVNPLTWCILIASMSAKFPMTITVAPESAGQRLDQFLTAELPDTSRARMQQLIAEEKALVNDAPAKPSLKLRGGESITILG